MNTSKLFMTLKEVLELTTLSKATLYRMSNDHDFPKPVKIGKRRSVWQRELVELWVRVKIAEAEAGP